MDELTGRLAWAGGASVGTATAHGTCGGLPSTLDLLGLHGESEGGKSEGSESCRGNDCDGAQGGRADGRDEGRGRDAWQGGGSGRGRGRSNETKNFAYVVKRERREVARRIGFAGTDGRSALMGAWEPQRGLAPRAGRTPLPVAAARKDWGTAPSLPTTSAARKAGRAALPPRARRAGTDRGSKARRSGGADVEERTDQGVSLRRGRGIFERARGGSRGGCRGRGGCGRDARRAAKDVRGGCGRRPVARATQH